MREVGASGHPAWPFGKSVRARGLRHQIAARGREVITAMTMDVVGVKDKGGQKDQNSRDGNAGPIIGVGSDGGICDVGLETSAYNENDLHGQQVHVNQHDCHLNVAGNNGDCGDGNCNEQLVGEDFVSKHDSHYVVVGNNGDCCDDGFNGNKVSERTTGADMIDCTVGMTGTDGGHINGLFDEHMVSIEVSSHWAWSLERTVNGRQCQEP